MSRAWLATAVIGCTDETVERVTPPAQSQPVEVSVATPCGHQGSFEALGIQVLRTQLPVMESLELQAQQEMAGSLNVVPAPCCACWESSSIAQCLLVAPEGCENLPRLVDRAARLAEQGVAGSELQMALSYGDIWLGPEQLGEWSGPPVPVQLEVWIDPSRPLMGAVWEQVQSLMAQPQNQGRLGIRIHYLVTGSEPEASDDWALGALAARAIGLEHEFLGALVETGQEDLVESTPSSESAQVARVIDRTRGHGFSLADWEKAQDSAVLRDTLNQERELAQTLGVRSAPTWFVNGYRHRGLQSQASLQRAIALELGE